MDQTRFYTSKSRMKQLDTVVLAITKQIRTQASQKVLTSIFCLTIKGKVLSSLYSDGLIKSR